MSNSSTSGSSAMDDESNTARKPRQKNYTLRTRKGKETVTNTIMFQLPDDLATRLASAKELDKDLSDNYGFEITGSKLLAKKLFVFPKTEEEHDTIIKNDQVLGNIFRTSLAHKSVSIIIRNISAKDIDQNAQIARELKRMGIIDIQPLIANQHEHLAVKGKCQSRAELNQIMDDYFVSGKKFTLITNEIIWVNFDPDIPKVVQCFNCLKIGHFANTCPNSPSCEICCESGHLFEKCPRSNEKPKCANCKKAHEATDNRCEELVEARREKIKLAVFHITGRSLERPIRFGKNKTTYSEAINKSLEAQNLISNQHNWFQKQTEKVNFIEKEAVEAQKKIEEQNLAQYLKLDKIAERIEKASKHAEETNKKIDESLKKIVTEMDYKLKVETARLDSRVDEVIDVTNQNTDVLFNKIERLEKWAAVMSGKDDVLSHYSNNRSASQNLVNNNRAFSQQAKTVKPLVKSA
jgi:hypothetical protein